MELQTNVAPTSVSSNAYNQTAYALEDGIPFPVKQKRKYVHRTHKYPFELMEKGQSFFVANKLITTMMSACLSARRRSNNRKTFKARAVEGGVRVWRIK